MGIEPTSLAWKATLNYTRGFLPGARLSALRLQIFLFTQTKLALSQYQPEFKDAYCARGEKEELIFTSSSHSY